MRIDQLTFAGPFRFLEIRWVTDDAPEPHRELRQPGSDLSDLPAFVADAAAVWWTDDLLKAFAADAAERMSKLPPVQPSVDDKLDALAARLDRLSPDTKGSR